MKTTTKKKSNQISNFQVLALSFLDLYPVAYIKLSLSVCVAIKFSHFKID